MRKHCSKDCTHIAMYVCRCADSEAYFCQDHLNEHLGTFENHAVQCLIIKLNKHQKLGIIPKVQKVLKYLQEFKSHIICSARELINSVSIEALKAVKNIEEFQQIIYRLINDKGIDIEQYEIITDFRFESDMPIIKTVEDINDSLDMLFALQKHEDDWKDCDQVIFSRGEEIGSLFSIDLKTFKPSNLDYAPKIAPGSQACKIDKSRYFFHGSCPTAKSQGETFIINIKDQRIEPLKRGQAKQRGASVLKDDKVYMFGGYNEIALRTCHVYDFKLNDWKQIDPLPKASTRMTAALIGKDIILSGLLVGCCYSYNDFGFTNIIDLPENSNKVVCEGWILCESILYEIDGNDISKWTRHNVTFSWDDGLLISAVFKRGKFIYFIDRSSMLNRIDTKRKIVQTCYDFR